MAFSDDEYDSDKLFGYESGSADDKNKNKGGRKNNASDFDDDSDDSFDDNDNLMVGSKRPLASEDEDQSYKRQRKN